MSCPEKSINKKIERVLQEYLLLTTNKVRERAGKGFGKRVIGKVRGRPEDEEISIDKIGEDILEKLLERHKLPALIFSEHRTLGTKKPEIFGALDPFDGSKLFQRGFEHMWYTALSFYQLDSQPLASGIADILNEKFYLKKNQENYLISLRDGKKTRISPSARKRLNGNLTIASYLMSSEYSPKFLEVFGSLIKNMAPKALLYPNGGSCIYAYLASGKVDAYIMFDEPRSEIDPGYPIAKAGGCQVVIVNEDGSFKDYEFISGRQHQKVNLLIATSTPELRDELIDYYRKVQKIKK